METKELLLSFAASLTLCDHMGDAYNALGRALDLVGIELEWEDEHELHEKLATMGVKTLNGTTLNASED